MCEVLSLPDLGLGVGIANSACGTAGRVGPKIVKERPGLNFWLKMLKFFGKLKFLGRLLKFQQVFWGLRKMVSDKNPMTRV